MEPVLLIHGYSAESKDLSAQAVHAIFGTLPDRLGRLNVVPPIASVNISRYVSLDDRVDIDDISLALDRALQTEFPQLLKAPGFNAIVHSTGALVIRNWVRRYSPKPSPVKRIIHLAGANLGSGWAHVGESLLAKWGRGFLFGEERGLAVLDGLELGSDWAIDLHRYFLLKGNDMLNDFGIQEFNVVGSQVPTMNALAPVRYGKEDGSDGVVRVSASNLNFHYLNIVPSPKAPRDWQKATNFAHATTQRTTIGTQAEFQREEVFAGGYYEIADDSRPDDVPGGPLTRRRPVIPLAIPYQCAHSGDTTGVVYGSETREQVERLLTAAFLSTPETYAATVKAFANETQITYDKMRMPKHRNGVWGALKAFGDAVVNQWDNPEAQYDQHAQVIVRVRDQNGRSLKDVSVHFNSLGGSDQPKELIDRLFEDVHVNNGAPSNTTFYLRTDCWDRGKKEWVSRLPDIKGVDLEVDCIDAQTQRILFVPLRMRISANELTQWIRPNRTTVIDVELLRLPSPDTFALFPV